MQAAGALLSLCVQLHSQRRIHPEIHPEAERPECPCLPLLPTVGGHRGEAVRQSSAAARQQRLAAFWGWLAWDGGFRTRRNVRVLLGATWELRAVQRGCTWEKGDFFFFKGLESGYIWVVRCLFWLPIVHRLICYTTVARWIDKALEYLLIKFEGHRNLLWETGAFL